MAIEWYEDNSMRITQTVVGSDDGATVVATLSNAATGTALGDPVTLDPTDTADEYAATVHPTGAHDLATGIRYRLRVVATYGGATLETEEVFTPRVRRG